jgi:glycosyltransferase involved in cell wall biosynthesis
VRCRIQIAETPLAGRKIFIYAGNMGAAQGVDIFIELAERLKYTRPDVGFLFVGRGRDAVRLRDKADALSLENVFFHDEVDPDEIPDLYVQCQVGLVALDARHKSHNIPGKFLTYMQSGLPVLAVVNRGNDLADLIRRERVGVACENHEIEDLFLNCLSILEQIDADSEVSSRCINLFENRFSVDQAVHQIIKALQT